MDQYVPAEAGRMEKRLGTFGTLMQIDHWRLSVHPIKVLAQNFALRKRLVACGTRKRSFAGVHHFVALEDLLLDERAAALVALERLLASVRATMTAQ